MEGTHWFRGGPEHFLLPYEDSLLGIKYFLTLGKLEIVPHPLLVPILALEPQEKSFQNKKDSSLEAVRPSWLGMWDEILTLAQSGEDFQEVIWGRIMGS